MTLKERLLSMPQSVTKEEFEKELMSEDIKNYNIFLKICERLEEYIIGEDVSYGTYKEIFDAIEDRNIDISNIVSNKQYDAFKRYILSQKVQCCPTVGKQKTPKYDLSNEEGRLRFIDENGFVQF